jgi:flagellar motility protein MotE (MotC chaperone)
MIRRIRLLPLVILAAVILLGVKMSALWTGGAAEAVATAWAQTGAAAPAKAATPPTAAKPTEMKAAAEPKEAQKPAPEQTPAAASPPASATVALRDPLLMSPAEIDELQQLSQRRAELEKRSADLREGEILMEAAEKRIEEKIAKLQTLQQSIDGAVQKQDEEEEARIKSLVRIYEAMKPQEAARIFEQLDMPVLLNVVAHMRERKCAPILAAMDPAKARSVTLALAERHKTEEEKTAPAR